MSLKSGVGKSTRSRVMFLHFEASNSGSTRMFLDFLKYLGKPDLEFLPFLCFYRGGPLLGEFESLGFPVSVFDRETDRELRLRSRFERMASLFWFCATLIRIRPRLLYSNSVTTSTSVLIAGCLGIRTIVHVHEGPRYLDRVGLNLRFSAKVTDRFIAGSRYCASGISGVLRRTADVVHNWTLVEAQGNMSTPMERTFVTIGVVGTIDRNKQQSLALLAIRALDKKYDGKFKLKIIGPAADVAYAQDLLRLAELLGVSGLVEVTGAIPGADAIYPQLDIVLIASMEETFSLVAIEAARFGKKIVAADVGGIREALAAQADARFFRAGDWRGLTAALESALDEGAQKPGTLEPGAIQDNANPAEVAPTGPARLLELIRTELPAN